MATRKQDYGNESISSLKGADRVRKRPGVIFGSDGLDGCEHAVFEILSNSIDEAREGHGKVITVTRFLDRSIQVEDAGRALETGNAVVVVYVLLWHRGKTSKGCRIHIADSPIYCNPFSAAAQGACRRFPAPPGTFLV